MKILKLSEGAFSFVLPNAELHVIGQNNHVKFDEESGDFIVASKNGITGDDKYLGPFVQYLYKKNVY